MTHWQLFLKFVKAELSVGGPDAQLKLLTLLPKRATRLQRVWLIGCYCAHHTSPAAWAVYQAFPHPRKVLLHALELRRWLKAHWKGLPLRREMRSHQMLDKRTDCLLSFAAYTMSRQWKHGGYDAVWESSIRDVKYFGRYMALKYLELLRLSVRPELELHDLRARHAWSPRITLAFLYPKHRDILMDRDDNSPAAIALTERLGAKVYRRLTDEGIGLNFFQLQVLLCNYKQAVTGRFYPGMGLDEEMTYAQIAKTEHFDLRRFYRVRRQLYRKEDLGEFGGWSTIRQKQLSHWKSLGAQIND